MHDTDKQVLEGMLAGISIRDRISVAVRSGAFTLINPSISAVDQADFEPERYPTAAAQW